MTGAFLHKTASQAVLLITFFAIFLVSGCATTFSQQTSQLPAPPAQLDDSALDNIRFQSPGGSGSRGSGGGGGGGSGGGGGGGGLLNDQSHRSNLDGPVRTVEDDVDRALLLSVVQFRGNSTLPTRRLQSVISSRPGRFYDPAQLQQDIQKIWRLPEVAKVNGPYVNQTPSGVEVTIDIEERNAVQEIVFIGNRAVKDSTLRGESGLDDIGHLDVHRIRLAKNRIEELYRERGFPKSQVEIQEGNEASDSKIVFLIHEDQKQRIWSVDFEGNSIASDGRLRSFIEGKPGIAKIIGGVAQKSVIDQDVVRLESYYKSLGFFNVQIGREITETEGGRWLNIRFIINEGPRYRVREVRFVGNQTWSSEELAKLLAMKPVNGQLPEFKSSHMSEDVVAIRDLYGANGFVFAEVNAEPRFLEEPGYLDMVYKIEEGQQCRVGAINIHYEGGNGITRHEVIRNRLGLRSGDLIDARQIQRAESRLRGAGIFATGQEPGSSPPRVVVNPPGSEGFDRSKVRGGAGGGSGSRTASQGSGSRPSGASQGSSGGGGGGSGSRF